MIDAIITERAQGNPTLVLTTRTKLVLKGFNPDKFTNSTPDDPKAIAKLITIAGEMGIKFSRF
jgi:hypothetical protein